MSTPDSFRWLKQPVFLNYGVAVLSVTAALFIARLMQIQYDFQPLTPFLCAVMLSAWFGGVEPGLLAVALSLLAFHHYFLIAIYPSVVEKEIPRLLLAGSTALFIMSLTAAQRSATEALRESELRLRQIAENIREVFWIATPAMDEMLYVSPAYESIRGRSLESLRQRPQSFFEAIHVDDRELARDIIKGQREQGFDIEYRIVRPDGSMRWIRDRGFPVKDASGKVCRIAGISEDITERKQAEKAALQNAQNIQAMSILNERHLRLVINTIPTMAWSLRPDGVVDFLNQRWLDYSGLSLEQYVEEPTGMIHPEDIPRVLEKWLANMAVGEPFEDEMRLRRADGEFRWFLVRDVPLRDERGNIVKWYGTSTDIEDRKRAEYALRDAASQLGALSRRLVEVQEVERKVLARELHDRIGQSLTALNINLNIMRTTLPPQASDELRARLADSETLVESTTAAIGNVVSELHPPMLDDHGLVLALDWYARQFSARTGVSVAVRGLEPAERPAPEMEIVLFRIAQEALNNVLKHARASRVEITLGRSGSEYVMSVADDGVGFAAAEESAGRHAGLGMVTMRERSQAVGGRFEVRGVPGDGTRLTVRVPA